MPQYRVMRSVQLWEENIVEAADEEEAIERAYGGGEWKAIYRNTQDIEVELA